MKNNIFSILKLMKIMFYMISDSFMLFLIEILVFH